jgi:hypothetical protein
LLRLPRLSRPMLQLNLATLPHLPKYFSLYVC